MKWLQRTLRVIRGTLLILCLAVIVLWVRSYWRYDALAAGTYTVASESGAVYIHRVIEIEIYTSAPAGEPGRMEVETARMYKPWVLGWAWEYGINRIWVVQWWFIAAALALPLAWNWRRRKARLRGFEVTQDAPALSHDRDARK
jgi:hypothetical protein